MFDTFIVQFELYINVGLVPKRDLTNNNTEEPQLNNNDSKT